MERALERVRNPLGFGAVDRALVVSSIGLIAVVLFSLLASVLGGWPYLPENADPWLRDVVGRVSGWLAVPWLGIAAFGFFLRRNPSRAGSIALVYATCQLYSLTIAGYAYVSGPFSAPPWIAFLGGAMVGFILFDQRPTMAGIATYAGVVSASTVAVQLGWIPDAAHLAGADHPDAAGSWRLGLLSVLFSMLTLGLVVNLVSHWRDRERRLEALAKTDPLTDLYNRRFFMELFERELEKARRYGQPISCVMVDLDHFKRINDRHGHLAGDQVLISAARAMKAGVRTTDLLARYGGEEFVIVLPLTDQKGAQELAERCRRLIQDSPVIADKATITVTASMGVATFPHANVQTVDDLLNLADEALYEAKEQGRDRIAVAS